MSIVSGHHKKICKQKAKAKKKLDLDIMARFEIATVILHEDIDNFEKQGEVSKLRHIMKGIETMKVKKASISSKSR